MYTVRYHEDKGRLLVITEKCAVVDDGRGMWIGLGHHLYDDIALLYPGDVAFTLRKEATILTSDGYVASSSKNNLIKVPVDQQWIEPGKMCSGCYVVFIKHLKVRVLESYIENANFGFEDMSCMRFI